MSKKHFIALADEMRNVHARFTSRHGEEAFAEMVRILADFCQAENSQFKRDRWLDYIAGECGPNGGAVKVGGVK